MTKSSGTKNPNDNSDLKVAIVHDWMLLGGAERVVEQLLSMYPDAPLYTSCMSREWRQKLAGRTVKTGYLNRWPFTKLRKFIPFLRAKWFEGLDFSGYDLVISSSGAEAKGINVPLHILHINYCHAPTHYYWSRYDDYLQNPGFGWADPLARFGLKLLLGPMRKWDLEASKKPSYIVANSTHTAQAIKKYYRRDADVIHPPVDTTRFAKTKPQQRTGFVVAGRQTPYKRIDLAVAAATSTNLPLTVIGNGPDHDRLVQSAGSTVTFKTRVTDQEMAQYFWSAGAFLFPGVDDFGIVAVEAMAAGCPVIAYQAGGALDYIQPTETGLFFEPQSADALAAAMLKIQNTSWNEARIAAAASAYTPEAFRQKMSRYIADHL